MTSVKTFSYTYKSCPEFFNFFHFPVILKITAGLTREMRLQRSKLKTGAEKGPCLMCIDDSHRFAGQSGRNYLSLVTDKWAFLGWWWHISIILRGGGQEDEEFKASQSYIEKPALKTSSHRNVTRKETGSRITKKVIRSHLCPLSGLSWTGSVDG